MKILTLYIDYFFFLLWNRLANAAIRPYLRYWKKADFDAVRELNSNFELAHDLSYVSLITKWLNVNIQYDDSENPDYLKEPVQLLFDKHGNCGDYARCICDLLNTYKPWYNAQLMIVQAPGWRGHCVCCVTLQDGIIHCGNWGTFVQRHQTLESLASAIKEDWEYFVIIDENLNLKEIKIKS